MSWSAQQYTKFENERTRPVRDLAAAIPTAEVRNAVDLGCGPGNSTEVLAARFPGAQVTGLDSSADMVNAARKRLPNLRFDLADIANWPDPGPYDVILANAVMQWVPDHRSVFPRLIEKLTPGGSLAVQMPNNLDEPAHLAMREVASQSPWTQKLTGIERTSREDARWYYELLKPLCGQVDVWRTTYHHVLAGGASGVVEWFKGSALRPFLDALEKDEQEEFLKRYEALVAKAYPLLPDGSVLLPFPRLFVVATK